LKKLIADIRRLLTGWKTKSYISKSVYGSIFCSDGNLPRAYGLPKVHKPGSKYRLIISSVDSPTYHFAYLLHKLIFQNIKKPFNHIDNSFELIKKLDGTRLNDDHKLVSLDVVSLFTNIPMELAITSLNNRWEQINRGTTIPKEEFLIAVRMVMDSTSFNNKIYKQKFGTFMGSLLSSIIADIVIEDLELEALNNLSFQILIYHRYVDDIMLAVPHNKSTELLDTFNSFHPRLKFTIEIGGKNLNFVHVTIKNKNNILEFDIYRKPTFSSRTFIPNPLSQKKSRDNTYRQNFFIVTPQIPSKKLKVHHRDLSGQWLSSRLHYENDFK